MPSKPLKPCNKAGCTKLTKESYCDQHKHNYDSFRKSATQRGYGSKWRKARSYYLKQHPFCVHCEQEGNLEQATVVDHIKPHKGDKELFWNQANWQPLCNRHHNIKTVKEDGGFGNG